MDRENFTLARVREINPKAADWIEKQGIKLDGTVPLCAAFDWNRTSFSRKVWEEIWSKPV